MNYPSRTAAMANLSRTVASVPRPPAPNTTSIAFDNLIYLMPILMTGGRGAETTVLLYNTRIQ